MTVCEFSDKFNYDNSVSLAIAYRIANNVNVKFIKEMNIVTNHSFSFPIRDDDAVANGWILNKRLVDYISKPLINLFDSIIDDKFNVYINKINVDYEPIEQRCYVSVDYVRDYIYHDD